MHSIMQQEIVDVGQNSDDDYEDESPNSSDNDDRAAPKKKSAVTQPKKLRKKKSNNMHAMIVKRDVSKRKISGPASDDGVGRVPAQSDIIVKNSSMEVKTPESEDEDEEYEEKLSGFGSMRLSASLR
jgi:hypothetical protein